MTVSRARLRAADPAPAAPGPDEALLRRLLAAPVKPRRGPAPLVPAAVVAVAVAAVAVMAQIGTAPDEETPAMRDLAQRAYETAGAVSGVVFHQRLRFSDEDPTRRIDYWYSPSDGAVLERFTAREPANGGETLLTAGRRLYVRSPPGHGRWEDLTATGDGHPGRLYRSEVRRLRTAMRARLSLARDYRRAYERDALKPGRRLTFAGRSAMSYREGDRDWFVDTATGRLLGSAWQEDGAASTATLEGPLRLLRRGP